MDRRHGIMTSRAPQGQEGTRSPGAISPSGTDLSWRPLGTMLALAALLPPCVSGRNGRFAWGDDRQGARALLEPWRHQSRTRPGDPVMRYLAIYHRTRSGVIAPVAHVVRCRHRCSLFPDHQRQRSLAAGEVALQREAQVEKQVVDALQRCRNGREPVQACNGYRQRDLTGPVAAGDGHPLPM